MTSPMELNNELFDSRTILDLDQTQKRLIQAEQQAQTLSQELFAARKIVRDQAKALKRQINQSQLLLTVGTYAQSDSTLYEFLQFFVAEVCKIDNWPYAHCYIEDPSNPFNLITSGYWYLPADENWDSIIEISRTMPIEEGRGIVGMVLEEKSSRWYCDLSELIGCPRLPYFNSIGIRSAFAVPILRYNRVLAVIEFFFPEDAHIDMELVELIDTAAIQLSALVERKHSEMQLKDNYRRLEDTINELQSAQLQLMQSEKMASLGQLAAGVAHEINNPIGFVMSNLVTLSEYVDVFKRLFELTHNLESRLSDGQTQAVLEEFKQLQQSDDLGFIFSDSSELLKESLDGVSRVKEIVQGLRTFAHVDDVGMREMDINESLEQTIRMVWNELKYKCEIRREYSEIPKFKCFGGQINQVFMNLLVNAGQAIEANGLIVVRTYAKAENIYIEFEDNGCGIPESVQSQIFNPFFTTKPIGQGTGLGLSISYGIVNKHQGELSVKSELGKGTVFSIRLPITVTSPHDDFLEVN